MCGYNQRRHGACLQLSWVESGDKRLGEEEGNVLLSYLLPHLLTPWRNSTTCSSDSWCSGTLGSGKRVYCADSPTTSSTRLTSPPSVRPARMWLLCFFIAYCCCCCCCLIVSMKFLQFLRTILQFLHNPNCSLFTECNTQYHLIMNSSVIFLFQSMSCSLQHATVIGLICRRWSFFPLYTNSGVQQLWWL